jgi:hypothetical protein
MSMVNKNGILIFVALVLVIAVFSLSPVPQDPLYHKFADQRTVFGIVNGYNVLSNVLFIVMGAWGSVLALRLPAKGMDTVLKLQYALFFAGLFLSGIGSSYYHYAPSNETLLWDRLPMSIAFMALLASVISECISRKAGSFLLIPFLVIGLLSVLYWAWTEQTGQGDLRPYILVQFLPVILVPLIMVMYKPAWKYARSVWVLAILYLFSKVFEVFDRQVYFFLGFASGHTIKHVLVALGTGALLNMLYARRKEGTTGTR